jgi:hygromycin-B 7''-O-kinase
MAGLLPAATEDAFTAICQDEAALRPGVERLCQRLGIDVSGLTRCAAGSRPVYAAGDLVLKLFPPVATWPGYRVEAEALTAVQGKLPTPTPQVHAAGEHDGWGYALMSRLPGVPLDTVWDQLSAGDRDRLAGRDHRGTAPTAATRDQGLVARGLASLRGRTARAMCQRAACSGLARDVGGSNFPVPR